MAGGYVALGDSMSIDDYAGGPGRGAASLLHRNHDPDFPDWAGRDLSGSGLDARILAEDGAVAADVLKVQLPKIDGRPAVVTLSVGGNDLLRAYGDDAATEAAIHRVTVAVDAILRRLHGLNPDGRVVVTTVYDPSDGTGEIAPAGLPPWPQGPLLVRRLNAELTDAAGRHGASVADVHRRFLGHGVTAGDPSRSDPRPAERDLWYCGVVEPNAWGAHEIRRAWWDALAFGTAS